MWKHPFDSCFPLLLPLKGFEISATEILPHHYNISLKNQDIFHCIHLHCIGVAAVSPNIIKWITVRMAGYHKACKMCFPWFRRTDPSSNHTSTILQVKQSCESYQQYWAKCWHPLTWTVPLPAPWRSVWVCWRRRPPVALPPSDEDCEHHDGISRTALPRGSSRRFCDISPQTSSLRKRNHQQHNVTNTSNAQTVTLRMNIL